MHQYKKSQDLEVFAIDYINNTNLQEVCDIRQPVIFDMRLVSNVLWQEVSPQHLAKYAGQIVEMNNVHDYLRQSASESSVDSVSMTFSMAKTLCDTDDQARYFSDKNSEFLESTGIAKRLHEIDDILKPTFTVYTYRDLLFGSSNTCTPLQYHTYYRRFLSVALGRIRIRMLPWKHSFMLNPIHDYEHYEFRSSADPQSLSTDILEFDVLQGSVLFIPPYWWYSIQYISSADAPETLVYSVSYMTAMNIVSNAPNLGLYWLQQQNIVSKVSKVSQVSMGSTIESTSACTSISTSSLEPSIQKVVSDKQPADETPVSKEDTEVAVVVVDLPIKNEQIVKVESKDLPQKISESVISVSNI
jgi:hypothetical protein